LGCLRCPALPGGDAIEVFVVAFDPEERLRRVRIRAGPAGEIANTDPQRHVRVPFHRASQRVEVAVNVGDRADQ
jgi:hypothetical protein